MLRFILNALLILLALRFVSLIARAITAGRRQEPRLKEEPHADEPQGGERQGRESQSRERQGQGRDRRSRPRIQRSDAVDVPFTEIPPDSPP